MSFELDLDRDPGEFIPFNETGGYCGAAQEYLYKSSSAENPLIFFKIFTERLGLIPFTGPYEEEFKKKFELIDIPSTKEIESLIKVYEDRESFGLHCASLPETPNATIERHEDDSRKALKGDFLTGFNLILRDTTETIGRISLSEGEAPNEIQCAMIMDKKYLKYRYGKEAMLILGVLLFSCLEANCLNRESPIDFFISKIGPDNKKGIKLAHYLGMSERAEEKRLGDSGRLPLKVFQITSKELKKSMPILISELVSKQLYL